MNTQNMEDVYSDSSLIPTEGVYGYDNEYSPVKSSDENLRNALKGMEVHNAHFKDPNPFEQSEETIAHTGFDYLKDLDNYITELQNEIKTYNVRWSGTETQQGLNERLEELNDQIEAKYANYRNGANRDADPEIEGLEDEYLELLELQEKELEHVNQIVTKIKDLQEARKRWVNDCKERYRHSIKKRGEVQDQLIDLKKQLKQLEAKQYMGENSQFIEDRIEAVKDSIARLEKQEREFHGDMGYGVVTVEFDPGMGKNPDFEYRPINVGKGKTVTKPADPILDDEHELDCWTLNGEQFDFNTPVNENIKLVAKYREKTKEQDSEIKKPEPGEIVKVTYNPNNGEEPTIIEIEKGTQAQNIQGPEKEGYKFDCWNLNGEPFNFNTPVNEDITLDANFKKVHRVQIFGGKIGGRDSIENKITTIEVLDGETIDFENLKNIPEYQANDKAQGKKNKILKGWETMNGEPFDINTHITADISINAKYKFDYLRVASGALGVGVSAAIAAVDQQRFGGTGIANLAVGAGSLIARGVRETKWYKLKNTEYEMIPAENLTGIKKASAKLKNYFHSELHYKRLNTFLTSLGISSLAAGIAHAAIKEPASNTGNKEIGEEIGKEIGTGTTTGGTGTTAGGTGTIAGETEETIQGYFEKAGTPDKIYDTAFESQGLFNAENPLPEFDGSMPTKAYNTATGQWMNIDKTTTLKQLTQTLGTDDPQILYTKNGVDMGWESLKSLVGGMSR